MRRICPKRSDKAGTLLFVQADQGVIRTNLLGALLDPTNEGPYLDQVTPMN